ncbi:MAG TPA: hypothetical protein VFR37_05595, partial [Longimicrobium sp.]|nr:hypothetical protein [Longimicrobium sp.]
PPTTPLSFMRATVKIPNEWLTQRAEDVPTSYQRNLKPGAALRTRMAWQKLKRDAQDGDEVWAFTSPPGSWRQGQHAGYALVREGRIVESVLITD